MDRQEAREQLKGYLREYVESVTEKSKGANMYVCPLCGSGSGAHGTGAFSIKNGTSWKCFSCNAGGDIFDLYGAINGTADHNAQLQGVAELYGVKVDSYRAKPDPLMEVADGYSQRYYRDSSSYDRGNSYTRRDSMGRYSRDSMMDHIDKMMAEANSDRERERIRRFRDEMSNA